MEDLGASSGEMNREWFDEKLEDFGCTVDDCSADETLQSLNALATSTKTANDDIVDALIAFILNLKRTFVTLDVVEDFVKQEMSKTKPSTGNEAGANAYNTFQRTILKEIPLQSVSSAPPMDFDFDCGGGGDFELETVEQRKDNDNAAVGNKIKLSYCGKLYAAADENAGSANLPHLRVISDCKASAYAYGNANVMFDISELFEENDDVDTKLDVEEKGSSINTIISGVIMPADGGHVLNYDNAALRTASRSVSLNVEKLGQVPLFPGKKLRLSGRLIDGVFHAERVIRTPSLLPSSLDRMTNFDQLKICVGCGPFASMDDESSAGSVFAGLLNHCACSQANALILVGPFLKKEQGTADASDDVLACYLQMLSQFLSTRAPCLRVFVVPCAVHDICSVPYFPTPPYHMPENVVLHQNITLLPDPAIVELEGIRFAITASDIVLHLSKREIYYSANMENEDRMQRLVSHILDCRSMYPLCPGDQSLPISLKSIQAKTQLTEKPHVMILPSLLQPFIKVVDRCVALNPGLFVRGKSGGTFGTLNIDLKSAVNSLEDSVEAFTSAAVLSNVIN